LNGEILHVQKVSGISGSERHLLSVLPLLRARGWDVRMLVLHRGEPGADEFLRALEIPAESWRMRADVDAAIGARLVARARGAALVHALPAALLARVPVRVAHHHGFNEFRERRLFAAADRAVERCATRHVAISSGLARYLTETEGLRGPFDVVHYGIAAGPAPPPPPDEPRLAAVGRLIPIKGLDVLLRAVARARERVPGLTLEIAGSGPLEAELRAAAPEGVTLLGRVAPPTAVLERAAIVVVPSRGEGFGMVALEAAERGRAVVATRVGGLPEIVADGETGVLVPTEDEQALVDALVGLATDPGRVRRLGAAARRRVLEEFPASGPVDELDRLYRVWLGEGAAATGRR
jgi:glycosyltransferase involved in cell wall biosynthesis